MISALIVEGLYCTTSDFFAEKIPNAAIVVGVFFALIGNTIYFWIASNELLLGFAVNAFSAALIAFIMYALHIWAGGDVKLFILLSLLTPADLYKQKAPLPMVTIYIIVFSVAFIYLITESIVLFLKKENSTVKASIRVSAKSIVSCMASIMALQTILRLVFGGLYYEYLPAFLLLNVMFVLLFDRIKFLNCNISLVSCSIIGIVGIIISVINNQFAVDVRSILTSVLVISFRALADKYNYKEINTTDVKKGMVLSYGTILGFADSKVKGLPKYTTEDIATRISQEEADSIVRWASSRHGKDRITVLRKIPFAFFIVAGFIIYLVLGVFVW